MAVMFRNSVDFEGKSIGSMLKWAWQAEVHKEELWISQQKMCYLT